MSQIRKLSAFRQLSLNCSPTPEQRRKTLRKQFSEDVPDLKDKWIDPSIGIRISLNTKTDRPPPLRIAWEDNTPELKAEDAVIIKKCKEVRRASTGKLSKQNSLERNSILHSNQELADKLKQNVKEKEEKTNLRIVLAHNSIEQHDDVSSNQSDKDSVHSSEKSFETPKLIQPLINSNVNNTSKKLFQIRKNTRQKINLGEIPYSPHVDLDIVRNDAVVVVPIIEKEHQDSPKPKDDIKPIDCVTIRPATAASKREKFQKRTNSVFNATIKESPQSRPPLIRSSSAPSKSERSRSKFSATKRKIKSIKRVQLKSAVGEGEIEDEVNNKENPKSQKELNRSTAVNGSEIVTMVSLVSPAGSDGEEEPQDETKDKCKNKTSTLNVKNTPLREDKNAPKNMSLRKIVKSVSFQQSSIHAIRSFSASFPARRGSMATALMLGNNNSKSTNLHSAKVQEKRSTNSNMPDDDERVPKRRLLRSDTQEEKDDISCESSTASEQFIVPEEKLSNENFTVAIKAKTEAKTVTEFEKIKPVQHENVNPTEIPLETDKREVETIEIKEETKYESQKEKQCWELYCRMKEKGINVSFDTILRGMLTPSEYRKSRKSLVASEPEEPNAC